MVIGSVTEGFEGMFMLMLRSKVCHMEALIVQGCDKVW